MRPYSPETPWDLDPAVTFLNHGSFGACPRPVLEAQHALRAALESNPVRFLAREHEARFDAARAEVAAFLHADPEGLVVVHNATGGVSTILSSLRLRPGDELLTTDHEYNATLNALAHVAAANRARVVTVPLRMPIHHPEEVTEAILGAVTPRTRIALVSHVTSPTGLVLPIESIVRELDRMGVDALVDGAHAPGMIPVDLTSLGAAYWTGNGHKWLCGPKGAGLLHVREDHRARVLPLVTSHGRNDPREDRPRLWREFDWQGTLDPTAFLALPVAIRTIAGLRPGGWPEVVAANRTLALEGRRMLEAALGVEPLAPESMVGSMAAVRLPALATDDEARDLELALADEDRIEVPIVRWPVRAARERPDDPPHAVLVRISTQLYNERADVERLVEALARRGLTAAGSPGARSTSAIVSG